MGDRTMSVPVMSGPEPIFGVDVTTTLLASSSRSSSVLLAIGGLGYFLSQRTTAVTSMPYLLGQDVSLGDGDNPLGRFVARSSASGRFEQAQGYGRRDLTRSWQEGHHRVRAVSLKVSIGVSSSPVTVPNVTGMTLSSAESILARRWP